MVLDLLKHSLFGSVKYCRIALFRLHNVVVAQWIELTFVMCYFLNVTKHLLGKRTLCALLSEKQICNFCLMQNLFSHLQVTCCIDVIMFMFDILEGFRVLLYVLS